MTDSRFAARLLVATVLALLVTSAGPLRAADREEKFEAQLVWGTNEEKSPDPNHKPVEGDLKKKLEGLPLKWKNYFEVNRRTVAVTSLVAKRVTMSDKCDVEIKVLAKNSVEVSLYSKGEPVLTRTQALPKDETLLMAGNAPNASAWFVVIKRAQK